MAAVRGALFIVIFALLVVLLWTKLPQVLGTVNRDGVLPASIVTGYTSTNQGRTITYRGKDGATALNLLAMSAKVQTVHHSPTQVVSIDGHAAGNGQHWIYTVDGFAQAAAPDTFVTHDGQTIVWQLQPER
ncbi:MAG: hypothetical protein U0514_00140 [Candidatus Andersenbacteria bacterium]